MNKFDINLDRLEKLSTIVIGILGLLATTYVTFWVIFPGHGRDNIKACLENRKTAVETVRLSPSIQIEPMAKQISSLCSQDEEESLAYLNNAKADAELNKQAKAEAVSGDVGAGDKAIGLFPLASPQTIRKATFVIWKAEKRQ